MTPQNLHAVILPAVRAALAGQGITLPVYADRTQMPEEGSSALSGGYVEIDWTGMGRKGPLATGLEKQIIGPSFLVFTPKAQGKGVALKAGGAIADHFRRVAPEIPAPSPDRGSIVYQSSRGPEEVGIDPRGLYQCNVSIIFNHYD